MFKSRAFSVLLVVLGICFPFRNANEILHDEKTISLKCNVDLVILLDDSGSICDNDPDDSQARPCGNWRKSVDFTKDIIEQFRAQVDAGFTRVGLVVFSSQARNMWKLNKYQTADELITALDELYLDYNGGTTHTDEALDMAINSGEFFGGSEAATGDRPDVTNSILLITDGVPYPPTREDTAIDLSTEAQDRGIIVFCVGVTEGADEELIRLLSSEPREEGKTFFLAPSFESLGDITSAVADAACSIEAVCNAVDTIFVLDGSGSIRKHNFELTKQFIAAVIGGLDVDNGGSKVGLITFSDDPVLIFSLGSHATTNETAAAVAGAGWIGGKTNAGKALKFVREEMLPNARQDSHKAIVVLSDGGSQDKLFSYEQAVITKREATVMVVDVGTWLDKYELTAMASYPADKTMFHATSYTTLIDQAPALIDVLCSGGGMCSDATCQQRGACVDDLRSTFCDCPVPYGGKTCEYECRVPGNVLFALDVSRSIGKENFMKVTDFVHKVAERLPLGEGADVGFVTWGAQVHSYMDFGGAVNKRDLMNTLSLPLFGEESTNTSAALDYITQMYDPRVCGAGGCIAELSGSRPVVALLTDGMSDSMENTWAAARRAREAGIVVIAFGLGQSSRENELRMMASFPGINYMQAHDYDELDDHVDFLHESICDQNRECEPGICQNGGTCVELTNGYSCVCDSAYGGYNCELDCSGKKDVVIMLDKSGSIRNNEFPIVKEFLTKILYLSEWNENRMQFALVSFGTEATVEYYFNQYALRQDQIDGILNVMYQGNKTDLSAAFDITSQEVFNINNGHREDADKIVVIFTDGVPTINNNDMMPSAEQLKADGAKIIAVGVGDSVDQQNMIAMSDLAAMKKRFAELTEDVAYGLAEAICSV